MNASIMSMPAEMPEDDQTLPSVTHRASSTQFTSRPWQVA